jgi:HlyD family secretion protein
VLFHTIPIETKIRYLKFKMKVNQMNSQPISNLLPLSLALVLALGLSACGDEKTPANTASDASASATSATAVASKSGKPSLTVTTIKTVQTQLPITFSANGNIAPWQEASVGSLSNGLRINQVMASVGDIVKKGQVLATFAAESVQADVAQTQASLLEAKANLIDANANAERANALKGTGALSTQQIEQYLTAAKSAQARVQAAQALLDAQNIRLKQAQLVAPDDGIISSRSAAVGSVAGIGTELFKLIRQSRLEWRGELTSEELAKVKVGSGVKVKGLGGTFVSGKIRAIAPSLDSQTRTALVYVDLPAGTTTVKAGMFARGEFELGNSQAQTLEQTALVVRDGFSYVFKVNPDLRVSRLKVQTGRIVGTQVELLTPLPPETLLVANGAGFLNDGDLVKVVASSAKSASPVKASASAAQ